VGETIFKQGRHLNGFVVEGGADKVLQVIPVVSSAFCIFGSELYTTALVATLMAVNGLYSCLLFHVNSLCHVFQMSGWLAFCFYLFCMYPALAFTLHVL
jgi:hypothetical protein